MRFGWVIEQSFSSFSLCFVWLTGMWLVKLLLIETIALPCHSENIHYHHSGNQMFLGLIFSGPLYLLKPPMLPVCGFLERFQLLLRFFLNLSRGTSSVSLSTVVLLKAGGKITIFRVCLFSAWSFACERSLKEETFLFDPE